MPYSQFPQKQNDLVTDQSSESGLEGADQTTLGLEVQDYIGRGVARKAEEKVKFTWLSDCISFISII